MRTRRGWYKVDGSSSKCCWSPRLRATRSSVLVRRKIAVANAMKMMTFTTMTVMLTTRTTPILTNVTFCIPSIPSNSRKHGNSLPYRGIWDLLWRKLSPEGVYWVSLRSLQWTLSGVPVFCACIIVLKLMMAPHFSCGHSEPVGSLCMTSWPAWQLSLHVLNVQDHLLYSHTY